LSIYKHLQTNFKPSPVARFLLKISLSGLLGLLLVTATAGMALPWTQADQSQQSVIAIIDQVFGPYGPAATRVAACESGLNPNAYNPVSIGGSYAEGLFQILVPSTWRTTSQAYRSPYDAWANTRAAYEIFVRDGYSWREWSCKP
jgi:lysozyme-like protein